MQSIVEGLVTDRCGAGDLAAIWAASPQAPVSHVADAAGAAVIWGDAIAWPGSERLDAAGLRSMWTEARTLTHWAESPEDALRQALSLANNP